METWIGENNSRLGIKLLLRAREIAKKSSKFNRNIIVAENPVFGKFLALGDNHELTLQVAEHYDFYSEMLVHVPLSLCENPRQVLVIGGGDGSVTREIFKHPVQHVDLVEIDREVTLIARDLLKIDNGTLDRANVIYDDGARFVEHAKKRYDVVICDITDPYPDNPAGSLATERFFENLVKITKEVAVIQSGSPIFQAELLSRIYAMASRVFERTWVYLGVMPIYPGGLWSFVLMSRKKIDPFVPLRKIEASYYSPEMHRAAFVVPPFIRRILGERVSYP